MAAIGGGDVAPTPSGLQAVLAHRLRFGVQDCAPFDPRRSPSSAATRFPPHPNPFGCNIADTSSDVFISSLRGKPNLGEL